LDLCLSCKACATDCPVGVDMATYKSEFLYHHYRHRLRPRAHYALGWLPTVARLSGWAPALVNLPLRVGVVRRLLAWAGGVTAERDMPRFHGRGAAWRGLPLGSGSGGLKDDDVLLFTDTFTRSFRPDLMGAAVRSLIRSGAEVRPVQGLCCGLTWISTGQLGRAKKVLARTVSRLDDGTSVPIVVLEPSCAAALTKDAPELLDTDAARRVASRITTYAEMIDRRLDAGWAPPALPSSLMLQVHCHEEYLDGGSAQRRVLERLGVRAVEKVAGCCGLAGNFGFERHHYLTSLAVAEHSLVPCLRTAEARSAVLADGFSCQNQIRHVAPASSAAPQHLAELIAEVLGQDDTGDGVPCGEGGRVR